MALIITLLIGNNLFCQEGENGKWLLNVSAGIEKHDKRLFDYVEKEMLLESQPESWGTYHLGSNIKRQLYRMKRITYFLGLGVKYEQTSFLRPFDQAYFGDQLKDLRVTNQYSKIYSDLSLLVLYKMPRNWIATFAIASNFLLYRNIDNTETESDVYPLHESTFVTDEINLMIGVNYQIEKWIIGFDSRLVNFQKIDKIIFNKIIKDPRVDQKWEWNNPLRFDFSIGYMW